MNTSDIPVHDYKAVVDYLKSERANSSNVLINTTNHIADLQLEILDLEKSREAAQIRIALIDKALDLLIDW